MTTSSPTPAVPDAGPTGTLYLIDLFAQIFRSYYAVRTPMHSPVTGEPTQVIYGVLSSLFKLITQTRPQYLAICADVSGPTFRDEVYEDYKGTRPPAPDDIKIQSPRIIEALRALGIPVIGVPGYEADDVIATIVQRVLDNPDLSGLDVCIVSRDKDLEQLLGDRVTMLDDQKEVTVTSETLFETKGVTPTQVVDLLTLMGDTSDNVPGAVGIGPKTAAQLLQEYGTIDGIYANIGQIKGKRRENLEAFAAPSPLGTFASQRDLSKFLVTLKRDADFPFQITDAAIGFPDLDTVLALFKEFGFNRFQSEARKMAAFYGTSAAVTEASVPTTTTVTDEVVPNEVPSGPPRTVADTHPTYSCVTTVDALQGAIDAMHRASLVAIDTETTGLTRDSRLVGLCLAWKVGHAIYVPVRSPNPALHLDEATVIAMMRPLLEDPTVAKCGHNIKFDAGVLLRCGIRLAGVTFDSMLAGHLLDAGAGGSASMDAMSLRYLHYAPVSLSTIIDVEERGPRAGRGRQATLDLGGTADPVPTVVPSRPISMDQAPLDAVTIYAAEDADVTLQLAQTLMPRLQADGMTDLMRDVEAPLALVLAAMEDQGILCDPTELRRQGDALQIRVDDLRQAIFEATGKTFTIDSTKQLAEVLFDDLGLAAGRKTKTGRSTDSEVLDRLAAQEDPADARTSVPRLVLAYRQLQKLISTYLGNLRDAIDPADGRIRTTFRQTGAATGRLASDSPNLQNIPVRTDVGRQIRKAFHAPPGHLLLCADYSQIELRVLAHCSEDPGLLDAFAKGLDIHAAVAAQVFGGDSGDVTREQRAQAKTINFGIIYGISAWGLARRVEGLDYDGAVSLIADYRRRFPGIDRFLRSCIEQGLEHGYVTTILGRRRAIPEILSANGNQRSLGERLAINTVVQGSAADLIKKAMVNVQARIVAERLPMRLLLQIHDELVFEAPEEVAEAQAAIVREEMERAMALRVPLVAEVGMGRDWMAAK